MCRNLKIKTKMYNSVQRNCLKTLLPAAAAATWRLRFKGIGVLLTVASSSQSFFPALGYGCAGGLGGGGGDSGEGWRLDRTSLFGAAQCTKPF